MGSMGAQGAREGAQALELMLGTARTHLLLLRRCEEIPDGGLTLPLRACRHPGGHQARGHCGLAPHRPERAAQCRCQGQDAGAGCLTVREAPGF